MITNDKPHTVKLNSPRDLVRLLAKIHDQPTQTLQELTIDQEHNWTTVEYDGQKMHLIASPEDAQILMRHPDVIEKLPGMKEALNIFSGEGVFASGFTKWAAQRPAINLKFNKASVDEKFDEVSAMMDEALDSLESTEEISPFNFCRAFALRVFCKTAFSVDVDFKQAEILATSMDLADERFLDTLTSPRFHLTGQVNPPSSSLAKSMVPVMRLIHSAVEERINLKDTDTEQPDDVLQDIINRVQQEMGDGSEARQQMKEETYHLFLAGHETTAATIAWALQNLAQNPEFQSLLQDQIDEATQDGKLESFAQTRQIPLLINTMQETLRRHPAPFVSFPRQASADFNEASHAISKGDRLVVLIDAIQHDPESFKQPNEFRPAHFDTDEAGERHPSAFMPFLTGKHHCPGRIMAFQEIAIALTTILGQYDVHTQEQNQPIAQAASTITRAPEDDYKLRFVKRTP